MYVFSNPFMQYFHSLEVVDRVSETQLQVGGNSRGPYLDFRIWRPQTSGSDM